MIEYNLQDKDGNLFELNGTAINFVMRNSLTVNAESFNIESRTEENSFLAGKVKIGENRFLSKTLSFTANLAIDNDTDFNDLVNTVIYQLNKAEYILDTVNLRRALVNFVSASITNDPGSYKRSAELNFDLELLESFWEDTTPQTITGTTVADTIAEITINNNGFLTLFPIIDLESFAACTYVEAVIDTQSIRIEDSLFGNVNYETMVIDNEQGFVSVGLNDRTISITNGLGFISVPVGSNTLKLITDVACDYIISYRRRYYV